MPLISFPVRLILLGRRAGKAQRGNLREALLRAPTIDPQTAEQIWELHGRPWDGYETARTSTGNQISKALREDRNPSQTNDTYSALKLTWRLPDRHNSRFYLLVLFLSFFFVLRGHGDGNYT